MQTSRALAVIRKQWHPLRDSYPFSMKQMPCTLYNPLVQEPDPDEILPEKAKKKKSRGQREADLKDFPEDVLPTHTVSKEVLDAF